MAIAEINWYESKKSARKSIKESSVKCVTFEQIVDSRFDDISKGEKILNDRKDEIIELCGDDFSVYTNKIEFLDWGDDESQYRQRYYIRKNNNNVSWNDLYKIVNSVKAVPYKFDKINDSVFESKESSRKSIKESNLPNKVYDVLNELTSNFLLDYDEFVEFERNGLEHHFDKIRELGVKLRKADVKGDDDLYQKIADEIVTVVKRANGTLNESKKSARKSIKESVDKTFFDLMCDKDFFKGVVKQVTKKEKCQFDFYKTPNSYTWLITYKENESLSINMDERTNDIFIHVTKNGKSEKDFKFPQLTFNDSVDELLEIIFDYVQGNFDSSWYESKKSARKSIKESTDIFDTLENAWDKSTMNNNVFEKTVLKLKTDSFKDPFDKHSTIYMFADGSSINCESLDPFDCDWCTYVSEDLSFVHEFRK